MSIADETTCTEADTDPPPPFWLVSPSQHHLHASKQGAHASTHVLTTHLPAHVDTRSPTYNQMCLSTRCLAHSRPPALTLPPAHRPLSDGEEGSARRNPADRRGEEVRRRPGGGPGHKNIYRMNSGGIGAEEAKRRLREKRRARKAGLPVSDSESESEGTHTHSECLCTITHPTPHVLQPGLHPHPHSHPHPTRTRTSLPSRTRASACNRSRSRSRRRTAFAAVSAAVAAPSHARVHSHLLPQTNL